MNLRRLVCPVDFSECSERGLAYAMDLGKQFGAVVDLLHVYQLPAYSLPDGGVIAGPETVAQLSDGLQAQLDAAAAPWQAAGATVHTHLAEGVPYLEIVNFAQRQAADLIVMASHGRTGFGHLLLGSVAERVVRTAQVPVLTVRGNRAQPASKPR